MSNRRGNRRSPSRTDAPVQRQPDAYGIVAQQVQSWQGPIPRPEDLQKYRDVDPGLPDRILAMAERTLDLTEKQTDHRIEMERRSILGMNFRANVGLWLGFILAVVVLGGSGWLIDRGHDAAGTTVASIDLVGLVGVFVYGRHDQARQERSRNS